MTHPVVWFEVIGKDSDKAQRYYADLFGWKMKADNPMKYGMIDAVSGKGIPGGVGGVMHGMGPWVTFYVECPKIEDTLAKAQKLGGTLVMPPTKMPAGPTLAMFKDPDGQVIGLVQAERA